MKNIKTMLMKFSVLVIIVCSPTTKNEIVSFSKTTQTLDSERRQWRSLRKREGTSEKERKREEKEKETEGARANVSKVWAVNLVSNVFY